MAMYVRYLNLLVIVASFVFYFVVFGRIGFHGIVFFFPFTMLPFVINAFLVLRWNVLGSQIVLLVTALGYAAWFAYLYLKVTVFDRDPQSPIAFLWVAPYAAPALLVFWWIAWMVQWEWDNHAPDN